MKVTFLVPPVVIGKLPAERSSGCTHVVYATPNIYELTLAAYVREQGHVVSYLDCVNRNIDINTLLSQVANNPADVYIIWTVNLSIANDTEIIKRIHLVSSLNKVVLVGPGASFFYKDCIPDEQTIVVHGEPELTVAELLNCFERKIEWKQIAGISYKQNDSFHRTAMRPLISDLDILPFPARDLLYGVDYRNPKLKAHPYTTMVTSRNCPHHCIYCVPSSLTFARELEYKTFNGKKPPVGLRSIENVAAELRLLKQEGYKAVTFVDDEFIWNENRTKAICAVLKEVGLVWSCQARVDTITERTAQWLSESNCLCVDLGVESFDDRILNYIHKGITSEQIYTAVFLLQKYKVPVKLNVLIGTCPLETKQTILHTLKEAKRLKTDQLMVNIVSPFPGTEFYKIAIENHWILRDQYVPTDVQRQSILSYPHLSSRQMERLLRRMNWSYYLNPSFVWKQIHRFHSVKDFIHACKSLKVKLIG